MNKLIIIKDPLLRRAMFVMYAFGMISPAKIHELWIGMRMEELKSTVVPDPTHHRQPICVTLSEQLEDECTRLDKAYRFALSASRIRNIDTAMRHQLSLDEIHSRLQEVEGLFNN